MKSLELLQSVAVVGAVSGLAACGGGSGTSTTSAPASAAQSTVNFVVTDTPSTNITVLSFRIDITVPGLNERHQAAIVRSVKTCLIHNTLSLGSAIEVSVNATASAQVLVARV